MSKLRILLVDDHAIVREGYKMLLQNSDNIDVCAEASTGEEACKLFTEESPDLVIMDLSLPGIGGIGAISRIIARQADAKIIVFTMHDNISFINQAMNAGAVGYLSKQSAPEMMLDVIKKVMEGEIFVDPSIAPPGFSLEKSLADESAPLSNLSSREFEIFCLLAQGNNTSEISKRLSLSYKTVANYSTQIKSKLNIVTLADLTRIAIRYKVIEA